MENQKKSITTNYQLYQLDAQFKQSRNIVNTINQCQDFYNGKQYPNENFNNMIRVVLNICSFSANIKASKICGTPIYLTFTADNNETDCTGLRQFDEYNCNKLHMKSSNYQAALNGFVNGTEITFIRWDDDDTTYKGIYKGGLQEEHIDIRNFAVANPYIQDIQNQAWVMFWEDYSLGALKDIIEGRTPEEKKKKIELLERETSNGAAEDYMQKEFINHSMCKMFTRFFRVDGEVYFMCSTQKVDLFAYPHPLSRKVGKSIIKKVVDEYLKKIEKDEPIDNDDLIQDYKIDYEDLIMCATETDAFTDKEYKDIKEKFSLYPFAVFRPFKQNRLFYGRSDVTSLISIQMGINFAISMMLKCAENNAYNKIFAKPEALQGQVITNEPSQVLIDYSGFTNGWGIKMAESQPMPNGLLEFTKELLGITRVIYGFNDVMDGSVTNQDMSGYMLQQMIKQSNTSIEQQQQLFWEFNEDKAAIRLLYYKHYVDKARYITNLTDAEFDGEEQARKIMHDALVSGKKLKTLPPDAKPEDFEKETHRTKVREISGEDLYGVNFDISIESMQGLADSKLVEQQMWDNLLLNGGINNIPPETLNLYLQASPTITPRQKAALNNVIKNLEQNRCRQLENQLKETVAKTQQIIAYAKQLESAIGYQGKYLEGLKKSFNESYSTQGKVVEGLTRELDKYKGNEGEVKSNNARGISSTPTQQQQM